ncbi:JAG1 protein, partial [Atractosteus spatula]|nr:JAG1 protein [Atractosteus spatula]
MPLRWLDLDLPLASALEREEIPLSPLVPRSALAQDMSGQGYKREHEKEVAHAPQGPSEGFLLLAAAHIRSGDFLLSPSRHGHRVTGRSLSLRKGSAVPALILLTSREEGYVAPVQKNFRALTGLAPLREAKSQAWKLSTGEGFLLLAAAHIRSGDFLLSPSRHGHRVTGRSLSLRKGSAVPALVLLTSREEGYVAPVQKNFRALTGLAPLREAKSQAWKLSTGTGGLGVPGSRVGNKRLFIGLSDSWENASDVANVPVALCFLSREALGSGTYCEGGITGAVDLLQCASGDTFISLSAWPAIPALSLCPCVPVSLWLRHTPFLLPLASIATPAALNGVYGGIATGSKAVGFQNNPKGSFKMLVLKALATSHTPQTGHNLHPGRKTPGETRRRLLTSSAVQLQSGSPGQVCEARFMTTVLLLLAELWHGTLFGLGHSLIQGYSACCHSRPLQSLKYNPASQCPVQQRVTCVCPLSTPQCQVSAGISIRLLAFSASAGSVYSFLSPEGHHVVLTEGTPPVSLWDVAVPNPHVLKQQGHRRVPAACLLDRKWLPGKREAPASALELRKSFSLVLEVLDHDNDTVEPVFACAGPGLTWASGSYSDLPDMWVLGRQGCLSQYCSSNLRCVGNRGCLGCRSFLFSRICADCSVEKRCYTTPPAGGPEFRGHEELIDRVLLSSMLNPSEQWQSFWHHGRVSLEYKLRFLCDANYYGPFCNKFCRARDDFFGHFTCDATGSKVCMEGWMGPECRQAVCRQGCHLAHGYCSTPGECKCHYGWEGPLCDRCVTFPGCVHGSCSEPWMCVCDTNWGGLLCDKVEPAAGPRTLGAHRGAATELGGAQCHWAEWHHLNYCGTHQPCQNGGTCANTEPNEYQCICRDGFRGKNCEIVEHSCLSNPCANGGTCVEEAEGFYCVCPEGWTGPSCTTGSECTMTPDNPTVHSPVYTVTRAEWALAVAGRRQPHLVRNENWPRQTGSQLELADLCCLHPAQPRRAARAGGRGVSELVLRPDIPPARSRLPFSTVYLTTRLGPSAALSVNECQPNPCSQGGTCRQLQHGFECLCPPQWTGRTCQLDTNECDRGVCVNAVACHNLIGGYFCDCQPGWTGQDCDITNHTCQGKCQNGGVCEESLTGYRCQCPPGFAGPYCQSRASHCDSAPCLNGGHCAEEEETLQCHCPLGYSGKHCEVVLDLCNPNPCQQGVPCQSTEGGYLCACPQGYEGKECLSQKDTCHEPHCQGEPSGSTATHTGTVPQPHLQTPHFFTDCNPVPSCDCRGMCRSFVCISCSICESAFVLVACVF